MTFTCHFDYRTYILAQLSHPDVNTFWHNHLFFGGGGCQNLLVSESNKLIQLLDLVLWIYRSISF